MATQGPVSSAVTLRVPSDELEKLLDGFLNRVSPTVTLSGSLSDTISAANQLRSAAGPVSAVITLSIKNAE